mgnify:CR=1 FL=1
MAGGDGCRVAAGSTVGLLVAAVLLGGVAAFDLETGVVSPGGVGYDINCGCRLMATNLTFPDIREKLKELTTALYHRIPSGVGSTGYVKLSGKDQKKVLEEGAAWEVKAG